LSFVLLSTESHHLWLSTVCLGISFSLVPAVLWPGVALHVKPAQLGTAYGLMTMMQNVGLTVSNVVAGRINDVSGAGAAHPEGYTPMLVFFGILSALAFAVAVLLRRTAKASARPG
jgi:MFS family permease